MLQPLSTDYFWGPTAGALNVAVSQARTDDGAPVIQWWDNGWGAGEQIWDEDVAYPWEAAGYGYGPSPDYLVNQNSGQCLTSDGVPGDQVYQWPCVGSPYQMWYDTNGTSVTVVNGPQLVFSSQHVNMWQNWASGLYLDVSGGPAAVWPGTAIDTWYYNGDDNQYFGEFY